MKKYFYNNHYKMSRLLSLSKLTDKERAKIGKDLDVYQEPSKYQFNAEPKLVRLYDVEGDDLFVPFAYNTDFPRPTRNSLPSMAVDFTQPLRENQIAIKDEAIQRLNSYGSIMISCYPGYGKTAMGIYIATKIKLKTLIVCHRVILVSQWKESILKFCSKAKIQQLTGKSTQIEKDSDFIIVNAINVPKYDRNFFKPIGLLICDEAHLIMADKLSQCMKYILPRYVIGLSATPYRMDGLNVLLDMYFGSFKIERKLYRKHMVYRYDTNFKPEIKMNKMNKVDWTSVIESQCSDREINEKILRVIQYFKDRVFLVLCKRVNQAEYFVERLKEMNEDVTSLIGSNQEYEQKSRILIGTASKVGVGFDHPRLDTLLLASDIEQYFIQYLGRVFRIQNSIPFIFDFVDDFAILRKHYKTRNDIYIEHGGTIKNFHTEFPDCV
jgi:superfamily II DNA or RNA helicase